MFFPNIKIGGASYPSVPSIQVPDALVSGLYNSYAFVDDSEPLSITENGIHDVTNYAQVDVNVQGGGGGGGLPTGISKMAFGTYTFDADMTGNSGSGTAYQKTINHNLGVTPDLILFYSPTLIGKTYSMLAMMWGPIWRTSYPTNLLYHGNSTTTVSGTSCSATYGIRLVTDTTFSIKTYSSSSSYFWRAGTYNWIAIKFS